MKPDALVKRVPTAIIAMDGMRITAVHYALGTESQTAKTAIRWIFER